HNRRKARCAPSDPALRKCGRWLRACSAIETDHSTSSGADEESSAHRQSSEFRGGRAAKREMAQRTIRRKTFSPAVRQPSREESISFPSLSDDAENARDQRGPAGLMIRAAAAPCF